MSFSIYYEKNKPAISASGYTIAQAKEHWEKNLADFNPKRSRGGYKMGYEPKYSSTYSGYNSFWVKKNPNSPKNTKQGYVEIDIREDFEWMANNPFIVKKNRYLEHRYIMEKEIGRYLIPGETVHHKNMIKNDNRIENLELWSGNHPTGARVNDRIKDSIKFLNEYGYKVEKT